jgi:hypothetical protein
MGSWEVLLEADGLPVRGGGLVEILLLRQGVAEVRIHPGAIRTRGQCRPVVADGLARLRRLRPQQEGRQLLVKRASARTWKSPTRKHSEVNASRFSMVRNLLVRSLP